MATWSLVIEEVTFADEGIAFRVDERWTDRGSPKCTTQGVYVAGLEPVGKPAIYPVYDGVNRQGELSGFFDKPTGTLIDYSKSPEDATKKAYKLALRLTDQLKRNDKKRKFPLEHEILDNTLRFKESKLVSKKV